MKYLKTFNESKCEYCGSEIQDNVPSKIDGPLNNILKSIRSNDLDQLEKAILDFKPSDRIHSIYGRNFIIFKSACEMGHVEILSHLLDKAKSDNIKVDADMLINWVKQSDHTSTDQVKKVCDVLDDYKTWTYWKENG